MRFETLPSGTAIPWCVIAILLVAATPATAQTENVILSFDVIGGSVPIAGLTADAAGNLYGVAEAGGSYGMGLVFRLTPKAGGGWTEKVLHVFKNDGKDGNNPQGTLVFDAAGNLYGTTTNGGPYPAACQPALGCGTVFELMPTVSGFWTEKILHNFNHDGHDGYAPLAGLVFDSAGNLYGTTASGGHCNAPDGCGIVFELEPMASGDCWTEKVLHNFVGFDGENPRDGLILDTAGNLYGTTSFGGPDGPGQAGTVFELTPQTGGVWTQKVLYTFHESTGSGVEPNAGLIQDADGNLYGTTTGGVPPSTVFELIRNTGFTFKVLFKLQGKGNGSNIVGGLVFDTAGNLYGTTLGGGINDTCPGGNGSLTTCGTVFMLTPEADGSWTEKVLHSFSYNGHDGFWPRAGLVLDGAGKLYGTTSDGGVLANCKSNPTYGCGTVFEVTP